MLMISWCTLALETLKVVILHLCVFYRMTLYSYTPCYRVYLCLYGRTSDTVDVVCVFFCPQGGAVESCLELL